MGQRLAFTFSDISSEGGSGTSEGRAISKSKFEIFLSAAA
jgi:hypothetical protein